MPPKRAAGAAAASRTVKDEEEPAAKRACKEEDVQKTCKAEQDVTTPASRSAAVSPGQAEWPRWQDPGDEGSPMTETYRIMKALVPWVRQELPAHLRRLGHGVNAVEAAPPLRIQRIDSEASNEGCLALSSYKEVWVPANCQVSMAKEGRYEAGGSLMWLDPGFVGPATAMLHEEPEWRVVVSYQREFFGRAACEEPNTNLGENTNAGLGRLPFPCTMQAYWEDPARDWSKMPSTLRLMGGQAMLFAWYLAAGRAMQQQDDALLKQLWQAALTCTIHVQSTSSTSQLALSAACISERFARFGDMADTFVHWASKVQKVADTLDGGTSIMSAQNKAHQLKEKGLFYRGAPVTKSMMQTVGHVNELFDEDSLKTLHTIEREFGRDLLSVHFTKMKAFMTAVKNSAASVAPNGKLKDVPSFREPRGRVGFLLKRWHCPRCSDSAASFCLVRSPSLARGPRNPPIPLPKKGSGQARPAPRLGLIPGPTHWPAQLETERCSVNSNVLFTHSSGDPLLKQACKVASSRRDTRQAKTYM